MTDDATTVREALEEHGSPCACSSRAGKADAALAALARLVAEREEALSLARKGTEVAATGEAALRVMTTRAAAAEARVVALVAENAELKAALEEGAGGVRLSGEKVNDAS